ncbi:hypothetical protein GWK47_034123 [Chionoecetes opilio]|uniref:Uncharacterized protein n=1 Tax=Chionoecetes opilio TaxID=41210 RepID=A0A8J4YJ80_CHIOP|nr:hypothetical protein GWK47_034123 [Chionoecetes opilio]
MKMRERKTFPRPSPLPRRRCIPTRGRRALWRPASKKEVAEGAVGQSRPRKTVSNHPGGPTSLSGQAAPKPGQEALEGRLRSESDPWRKACGTVAGPERKGPRPEPLNPEGPTPTGTTRILGAIHTGVSTPGLPSRREEPRRTLPDPHPEPPAETVWGRRRHQSDGGGD